MAGTKRFLTVNKDNLRRLRMQKGWSQDQLAKRAGYSERLIRKAESGGTVSAQTIHDLADALGDSDRPVTYQELVTDQLSMAQQFLCAYDQHGQWMLSHCEEILHKTFVFHSPGDTEQVPFAGEWHGLSGMQTYLDRFYSVFARKRGSIQPLYLVGEERVCVRYLDQVYYQGHGLPPYWVNLHIHFEDGAISRVDNEYDSRAAAEDLSALLARLKKAADLSP